MLSEEADVDIHALKRQAMTISEIARRTIHDRRTIRAYLSGQRTPGVRAKSVHIAKKIRRPRPHPVLAILVVANDRPKVLQINRIGRVIGFGRFLTLLTSRAGLAIMRSFMTHTNGSD
ncbi:MULTISPECIES: hypothetical protein [Agromyces]|uniref:hypothetical protein n=1 Tax=Agromyces TaxID=33877 RepID=UPI0009E8BC00|nr:MULTISPECIES: hypothetical protein [Agromyces]